MPPVTGSDVDAADARTNDQALRDGRRLLSAMRRRPASCGSFRSRPQRDGIVKTGRILGGPARFFQSVITNVL